MIQYARSSYYYNNVCVFFQTLVASTRLVGVRSLWTGQEAIGEDDPELAAIIKKEKNRQVTGLELIASEVRYLSSSGARSTLLTQEKHVLLDFL